MVYAKKELNVWQEDVPPDFNQGVTVKVKCGSEDVAVHVIYRSPNSTRINDASLNNWIRSMNGISVLIGDLNYPDIDWLSGTAGSRGREFYEATTHLDLASRSNPD